MRIVRDEPPRLLLLEAPVVAAPKAVRGCLGVLLFGLFVGIPGIEVVRALLRGAGAAELAVALPFLLAGAALAALAMRSLRGAARYVRRLRVDGQAGELTIDEQSPLGGARSQVVALDRLERIVAEVALVKPSAAQTESGVGGMSRQPRLGLRLQLEWKGARERKERRRLSFIVAEVDERQELVDLAYRLARAAGLRYTRVARNDPSGVEVELGREQGAGLEPLPLLATAGDYAQDQVSPQAERAAAQERVAPFVPSAFRGDLRCTVWRPGQQVTFRQGPGVALGCLPFALLLLAGPAFYALGPLRDGERLPASIVLGMFGLFLGSHAIRVIASRLPRSVKLDWEGRKLERRGLFRRRSLPFSEIKEVELRCIAQRYRGSNMRLPYHKHRCEIVACLRTPEAGEPVGETLVATESFTEDKETPYRMALPLATELAQALGVPRRVTGCS
jgi:hypothetical protein